MKINVRVLYDGHERTFEISCGTGENKSFKWLSNVACQRYSLAAPNGALRHRDHFRGVTENTQYPAVEIHLPDGEIPHPSSMLSDFLRDGDFVILRLGDKLRVESKSGAPKLSHWATVAFTSNSHKDHAEDEESQDDSGPDPHIRMEMTSKSEFMRLILCSQMPNQKRIDHCVVTEWPKVTKSMPKLTPELSSAFQSIFKKYWSTLSELFQLFGQDGRMSHENFYQFVTEINLFSMKDTSTITKRIFGRICKAANVTNYIDIGLLMVALLLCAQVRHNDTFEFSSHVETATQALEEIFEHNIMNYAENQGLPSVLKGHFSSDYVLYLIRDKHDKLFSVYEAYAVRSHELPTSLTAEDMSQLLQDAKLQYEGEGSLQRTRQLLSDVRKGLVIGREPPGSGESKDEVVIPDNEFTYPEYVEAVARAGYFRYYTPPDPAPGGDEAELLTIPECLFKGVESVHALVSAPSRK